jgi:hypothetical protein
LLIAGLLIGAVLNSRGISESAKSLRLQKQVEELIAAVELFEDKKSGNLPGAASGTLGDDYEDELVDEGLLRSTSAGNKHPFGQADSILFRIDANELSQPFIVSPATGNMTIFRYNSISSDWAQTLDLALDDGEPNSGFIQVTATGAPETPLTAWPVSVNNIHVFVRYR